MTGGATRGGPTGCGPRGRVGTERGGSPSTDSRTATAAARVPVLTWALAAVLTAGPASAQDATAASVGDATAAMVPTDVPYDRMVRAADEPWNWFTYSGSYAAERFSGVGQDPVATPEIWQLIDW